MIAREPELIDPRRPHDRAATNEPIPLEGLEQLAGLMDSLFEIPGTRIRVGLDAVIGLVPVAGDLLSAAVSMLILKEAQRRGVSKVTLARMGGNIALDWLIGSIPLVGDAFDVYWKANQRNVQLLQKHASTNPQVVRRAKVGDLAFLVGLIAILLLCLLGCLTLTWFLLSSVIRWLS